MSSYLGQWHRPHYLSIKEGSLFVLFCFVCLFVCQAEISQTMVSFTALSEWLENFWQVLEHWGCFIMCTHMVLDFMNIFKSHCKFNKIKTKKINEIWGMLLLFLENVQWIGFYGGNFIISTLNAWERLNFDLWYHLKIK
jgi:hypothetical protein